MKDSLAYINALICAADHGRVLGYDNSHDHHHRHFMGDTQAIEFSSYALLVARFEPEVRDLWRREDEPQK